MVRGDKAEMKEIAGSEFELKADLALPASGFTGPVVPGLVDQTRATLDPRGNAGEHERLSHLVGQDLRVR